MAEISEEEPIDLIRNEMKAGLLTRRHIDVKEPTVIEREDLESVPEKTLREKFYAAWNAGQLNPMTAEKLVGEHFDSMREEIERLSFTWSGSDFGDRLRSILLDED